MAPRGRHRPKPKAERMQFAKVYLFQLEPRPGLRPIEKAIVEAWALRPGATAKQIASAHAALRVAEQTVIQMVVNAGTDWDNGGWYYLYPLTSLSELLSRDVSKLAEARFRLDRLEREARVDGKVFDLAVERARRTTEVRA